VTQFTGFIGHFAHITVLLAEHYCSSAACWDMVCIGCCVFEM